MDFPNFDPILLSFLQKHNVQFTYHEHVPIFTVEEGASIKHMIPWLHTKNLFLTDKRGQYYLVSIESSKRLAINQFRKLIVAKDMTFGTPEAMKEILWLTPGSVSLFGLVNFIADFSQSPLSPKEGNDFRIGNKLTVFMDRDLRQADSIIWCHPNRNDATLILDHENMTRYFEAVWCRPIIIEIGDEVRYADIS